MFMRAFGWPVEPATYVARRELELEVYRDALVGISFDHPSTEAGEALAKGKAIREVA